MFEKLPVLVHPERFLGVRLSREWSRPASSTLGYSGPWTGWQKKEEASQAVSRVGKGTARWAVCWAGSNERGCGGGTGVDGARHENRAGSLGTGGGVPGQERSAHSCALLADY